MSRHQKDPVWIIDRMLDLVAIFEQDPMQPTGWGDHAKMTIKSVLDAYLDQEE